MHVHKILVSLGLVFILQLTPGNSFAVEPPLAHFMPKEAGLFIQIDDLRDQWGALKTSPLAVRVLNFPVVRKWLKSDQFKGVRELAEAVEDATGDQFENILLNFAGENCVFATAPVPNKKQPTRVFITRTRSAKFLKELVKNWNNYDHPKTEIHQHLGMEFVHRKILNEEGRTVEYVYYAIQGRDFILADLEPAMRKVLELRAEAAELEEEAPPKNSLAALEEFQTIQKRIEKSDRIRIYVQPAVWGTVSGLPENEARVFKPILSLWNQSDAIYSTVQLQNGILWKVNAYRKNWGQKKSPAITETKFGKQVPANAFFAIAGTGSWKEFGIWLDSLLVKDDKETEQFRRVMAGLFSGYDLFRDLVTRLGPEWSLFIEVSPKKKNFPVDATLAVDLSGLNEKEPGQSKEIVRAIENGLSAGINLISFAYNTQNHANATAIVRSLKKEEAVSKWIENVIDWSPGYLLANSRLAITTDRHRLIESRALTTTESLFETKRFQKWIGKFTQSSSLLWFDARLLRNSIDANQKVIVASLSKIKKQEPDAVTTKLSRLTEVLHLFDAVAVQLQFEPDELRLAIDVLLDQPDENR